jgi:hypothetical protein
MENKGEKTIMPQFKTYQEVKEYLDEIDPAGHPCNILIQYSTTNKIYSIWSYYPK